MYSIGVSLEKSPSEESRFKIAILKKEGKKILLHALQSFSACSEGVKLFYNLPPFQASNEVRIVSGLCGAEIFMRKLHLPLKEKRKILATLPFQLEALLPYSPEIAVVCPLLNPINNQMTSVTLFATTREHLQNHLATLKNLEIQTDVVSCAPAALARFAKWNFPKERKILSFHVQGNKILYVVSDGHDIILSQTLQFQGDELSSVELEKLSIYLKQKGAIDGETPWVLTGDQGQDGGLFSPFFLGPKLRLENEEMSTYAIAIGLALDAIAEDQFSVQFCQKEFTLQHTKQNRNKRACFYLALCLACGIVATVFSTLFLGAKERSLVERINQDLPSALTLSHSPSYEEMEHTLFDWEKSLNKQKGSFPLLPTVPKLSDVLAWLSTHPIFTAEDGGKRGGSEVKSLHYQLVKYPKIGESGNPYQALLSLEFSTDTPRLARDFHEMLLKGDQMANSKKEVSWQVQNQNYSTSFELNRVTPP